MVLIQRTHWLRRRAEGIACAADSKAPQSKIEKQIYYLCRTFMNQTDAVQIPDLNLTA